MKFKRSFLGLLSCFMILLSMGGIYANNSDEDHTIVKPVWAEYDENNTASDIIQDIDNFVDNAPTPNTQECFQAIVNIDKTNDNLDKIADKYGINSKQYKKAEKGANKVLNKFNEEVNDLKHILNRYQEHGKLQTLVNIKNDLSDSLNKFNIISPPKVMEQFKKDKKDLKRATDNYIKALVKMKKAVNVIDNVNDISEWEKAKNNLKKTIEDYMKAENEFQRVANIFYGT